MKLCKSCGSPILENEKRCKYCHAHIKKTKDTKRDVVMQILGFIFVSLLVALFVLLAFIVINELPIG